MPPPIVPPDILIATVTDVRPLSSMLRSLAFKSNNKDGYSSKALMEIRKHGIKITVEEGQSLQANAYITASSFAFYMFEKPKLDSSSNDVHVRHNTNDIDNDDADDNDSDQERDNVVNEQDLYCCFGISLNTVLECLNIFGNAGSTGLTREWSSNKDELTDMREHQGGGGGGGGGGRYGRSRDNRFETEKRDDGNVTSLRMTYAGEGEPLVLLLEEGGIVTRCEITTYEPDQVMDIAFDDDKRVQKLIMKSEWLRDAFLELEPTSQKVVFHFSPPDKRGPVAYNRYRGVRPQQDDGDQGDGHNNNNVKAVQHSIFRLESIGTLGSTEMDYPNDRDVLETYECFEDISNSYRHQHIMYTMKALVNSIKVSIRTQDDGIMSFQFMIPMTSKRKNPEASHGFVEFLCVALDDEY
ncbi:checkpoint clamp complex protein Rad1 [Microbotryomycetes sp. JL221]|nr:checkpoint clamp complex protein Rad1 [Microbotryomycetes sp. JL221]